MTGARIFRLALRDSLPVLMGYTTMGFVAGVLLAAKGNVTLAPLWAFLSSALWVTGTMSIAGVPHIAAHISAAAFALMTLAVNFRYAFYGFSYIKRFTFGGMINNKDYRLAPEKSKLLFFEAGCPAQFYVKFKPAKGQKIHQMLFEPLELVDKGGGEKRPVVELRGATARGIQLTTKAIARISTTKGSWWDEGEGSAKGVLL